MPSSASVPLPRSDVYLVLDGVKAALAKFPRPRNPIERTRRLGQSLVNGRTARLRAYYRVPITYESKKAKTKRIKRELLEAGATIYGLLKSESRYLPKILHDQEHIEAVVYGLHSSSSAMMVATDERIIYLDKKPMVELFDEVSYEVISGIEFDIHLFFATLVLHTPVKNYDFKYVNIHCAEKFARHIEKHRLDRQPRQDEFIKEIPRQSPGPPFNYPGELNDMAGYYWLPVDEEERRKIQQLNT